jgi:hypothetical protein
VVSDRKAGILPKMLQSRPHTRMPRYTLA